MYHCSMLIIECGGAGDYRQWLVLIMILYCKMEILLDYVNIRSMIRSHTLIDFEIILYL